MNLLLLWEGAPEMHIDRKNLPSLLNLLLSQKCSESFDTGTNYIRSQQQGPELEAKTQVLIVFL